jgi:uncharacterized membrane protein
MDPRIPRWFFIVFALYAILQFSSDYSHLPNVVASHFDAAGVPNGWQTKQAFAYVYGAVLLLAAGLVFVIPPIVARSPSINLPNRDYWLAPSRREATVNYLSAAFAWFGCAVLVLMVLVFRFAAEFNMRPTNPPDAAVLWYYLIAFTAFTVFWLARMVMRFNRVPSDAATSQSQGLRK